MRPSMLFLSCVIICSVLAPRSCLLSSWSFRRALDYSLAFLVCLFAGYLVCVLICCIYMSRLHFQLAHIDINLNFSLDTGIYFNVDASTLSHAIDDYSFQRHIRFTVFFLFLFLFFVVFACIVVVKPVCFLSSSTNKRLCTF